MTAAAARKPAAVAFIRRSRARSRPSIVTSTPSIGTVSESELAAISMTFACDNQFGGNAPIDAAIYRPGCAAGGCVLQEVLPQGCWQREQGCWLLGMGGQRREMSMARALWTGFVSFGLVSVPV